MATLTVRTENATGTALPNTVVSVVRLRSDNPTTVADIETSNALGIATFELDGGRDYLVHWRYGNVSVTRRIRMPAVNAELQNIAELDSETFHGSTGSGTGVTIAQVNEAIQSALAAFDPGTGTGTGTGLSQQDVQTLIDTHSSNANAHHNPPDVSEYITESRANAIANQIVNSHAANANAHHVPPDVPNTEAIQDIVAGMFSEETRVTYNDSTGKLDISFPSGTGGTTQYGELTGRPIEVVTTLPDASSSTLNKRYQIQSTSRQFIGSQQVIHGADRVVNLSEYPVVTSGAGYRGAVYSIYDLPAVSPPSGSFYMLQYASFHHGEPWVEVDATGSYQSHAGFPGTGTYRGAFLSEDEAKSHVRNASDVVAYGTTEHNVTLYDVDSDFTAGTADTTHYIMEPTDRVAVPDIDTEVEAIVSSWALSDNTDEIPSSKHDESFIDSRIAAYLTANPPAAGGGGRTVTIVHEDTSDQTLTSAYRKIITSAMSGITEGFIELVLEDNTFSGHPHNVFGFTVEEWRLLNSESDTRMSGSSIARNVIRFQREHGVISTETVVGRQDDNFWLLPARNVSNDGFNTYRIRIRVITYG